MFLYFRMFLTMGVGLYTSRLVLQTLGVEDFGIYGLVGGIVTMFAFLNSAMSTATQRYLSFDIGKGDTDRLKKTFNATLNIHILIAGIIVLLAETVGLWFVNYKLNIPTARMHAANWVYQFSIFTFVLGVIQVPYNALLIAREHMNVYAYMSILESVLKLVIVFILVEFGDDKLILYAILTFIVSFIVRTLYKIYCKKHFKESQYEFYYDKSYYKELLSYSGWSLFGQIANILSNQGVGILFNLFLGITLNATLLIVNQVHSAIYSFVSNFQTAFNPQIIKRYAENNLNELKSLILSSSKISFVLISMVSLPILLFTKEILIFWLGNELPEYTIDFVKVIIVIVFIDAIGGPFWTAANAFGHVKNYNLGISCINICTLPIMYIFLKANYSPNIVFLIKVFISFSIQLYRFYYVNSKVKFSNLQIAIYLKLIVVLFTYIGFICILKEKYISFDLFQNLIFMILVEIVFILTAYSLLKKEEKDFLKSGIINVKKRFLK